MAIPKSLATKNSLVITSYSIHYTKLYETLHEPIHSFRMPTNTASRIVLCRLLWLPRLVLCLPNCYSRKNGMSCVRSSACISKIEKKYGKAMFFPLAMNRITSYNVCYTKLLRSAKWNKGRHH